MSREYCLPIRLIPVRPSDIRWLLCMMYAVPLILVFLWLPVHWALMINLLGLMVFVWEFSQYPVSLSIREISINKSGQWHICKSEGIYLAVVFKRYQKMFNVIFLLVEVEGRATRMLIHCGRQDQDQLHRFKLFVRG